MHQFHSSEANPPDSRHTVSYIEYYPSYVLSLPSHTRVHALLSLQITLDGCGESRGFFALSSLRRRQGDKASIDNPLNDPSFDAVDRTGLPTFGGRPLFRVVGQISNQCQIAFPVIGASLFIFVPCF